MVADWDELYVCNPYSESGGIVYAIRLSRGSLESKRDAEETEGRFALRTIIIVTKSILIETFLYMFLQLISMSLRRFASEA